MKVRKQYMTLLEALLSLTLIAVLLSSLLGSYWMVERLHLEWKKEAKENLRLRYVQTKLQHLLAHLPNTNPHFYVTPEPSHLIRGESLVFSTENTVDIHPEFAKRVLARLFVDQENRLYLSRWPEKKREVTRMQKQLLLTDVEHVTFTFPKTDPKLIPASVTLTITRTDKREQKFALFIPTKNNTVVYPCKFSSL